MDLDLKRILLILWRRRWIIGLSTVVFAAIAFFITSFAVTPLYSATTSLYVYNNENRKTTATISQNDITVSQKLVDTYIVILKSDAVLEEVSAKTGFGYSARQIGRMISASAVNETEVFTITVTCADKQHAAIIANTIAEVGEKVILRVVKAGAVEVIDVASPPNSQSYPSVPSNTLIGGLLGIALSVLFIVVFELMDTRVKAISAITDTFNLSIIGAIPSIEIERQMLEKASSKKNKSMKEIVE